jgi:quinol monooxygenase YgiN
MEILIAGTVDVDPEQREAALAAAEPLLEPTRAQPGCIAYLWAADPAVPGRILVYERWSGRDELAAHFAGPWYRRMLETIGRHGLRGADVAKFEVARSEPVYDSSGAPRADFFTRDAA